MMIKVLWAPGVFVLPGGQVIIVRHRNSRVGLEDRQKADLRSAFFAIISGKQTRLIKIFL